MRLPVFKAFSAGLALLFGRAPELIKALWLPALILIAAMSYIMPQYMTAAMEFSAIDPETDPAELLTQMGPMFKSMGILYLAMALIYPMLIAGNLKYIVRGQSLRLPFYLQFGFDELRILFTYILFIIMMGLVYMVGFLGLFVAAIALAALSPAIGGAVAVVAAIAGLIALFWFMMRLSLMFPATIEARTIGIARSWQVTKGNTFQLFVYWVLWMVIFFVVFIAYFLLALPGFLPLISEMMASAAENPDAVQEFELKWMQLQADMWDMSKPGFWAYVIATYIFMMVYAAFWNVASGVAYRYLVSDEATR